MNEDNYDIDEYFQEIRREAAEKERSKIVAWLRNSLADTIMFLDPVPNIDDMADEIEAGEHLK